MKYFYGMSASIVLRKFSGFFKKYCPMTVFDDQKMVIRKSGY